MDYHVQQGSKTKFLNVFRRLFTIPFFERGLLSMVLDRPQGLLHKLIPPDYLYCQGSFRTVERQGIRYRLDISHVVDHYIYYAFSNTTYASLAADLKKAKVILDIGANIGSTALYFAGINPQAKIIAFEPHPATFKRAMENISLNDFKNIRLLNIGLGDKKDTLKLYEVNPHNPGMNRIISEDRNLPYAQISVETLDQLLEEQQVGHVDFIKIDVEGFEYAVLSGGSNMIRRCKPSLFIELDDNNLKENKHSATQLVELLHSFGYNRICRADDLSVLGSNHDFRNCHYDIIARSVNDLAPDQIEL